ncbi:alpha/beta hydrolase [uncultured Pseudacidovorax sp.]|uniref:alpha/beta hydrolase family protein n=1 Tax=uncultured Pseudacidovorax sp. TaxID=679313 RepID=UPI0025F27C1F|nr:alpha/beta hydrolase [uncultured Pseudacidovorax sp.]
MKPFRAAALLALLAALLGPGAHAAGLAFIAIPAAADGPALQGAVWTPCATPATDIVLEPLVVKGVRDCPVAGNRLPMVVMSHGTGGSAMGHHDTAAALADAGFVVAAIAHPGDNFRDLSRQARLSTFATRPVDMRRLVDHMLGRWPGHAALDPQRIGIFGFSRGGYTALALVGAQPDWTLRRDLCPAGSTVPLCQEAARGEVPPPPVPDVRIRAAVVVDPLSMFAAPGLKNVRVPVQLWASEFGGDGVTPESVAAVRDGLPTPPEWQVAEGAAHFAFLAPCSAAFTRMAPEICKDGPGFDRTAFHQRFNAAVVAFFRQKLATPAPR